MVRIVSFAVLMIFAAASAPLYADDDSHKESKHFVAKLSGYNEVHFSAGPPAALRGAISTGARGSFKAKLDKDKAVIHYELSYEGLRGNVTQAHIHFGQRHTVGGIVVWLCGTQPDNPGPTGTPTCPQTATGANIVTGTITAAQILPQDLQGFSGDFGDFDALVAALRAGAAYANVHSSLFGPGEIRGQIRDFDKHKHGHND